MCIGVVCPLEKCRQRAFGVLGVLLTQLGFAPAGAFLSDPHTAEAVSYLFSGVLALVGGAANTNTAA